MLGSIGMRWWARHGRSLHAGDASMGAAPHPEEVPVLGHRYAKGHVISDVHR